MNECKLMKNANNKDETPLKPLPLSLIPKQKQIYTTEKKRKPNWFICIVLCSVISAILSILL